MIKTYKQFNESFKDMIKSFLRFSKDTKSVDSICRKYGIKNYTINPDGSIDVNGNVNLSNKGLTKFTLIFNKVSGYFYCYMNQLTSLEGCPKEVGGDFDCSSNKLTSLEGCPNKVDGNFDCYNNELTSLEGCPNKVGGHFDCPSNQLTSLEGCPKEVGGYFNCSYNQLTSLEHCPKQVGRNFSCRNNQLVELIEFPYVGGDIDYSDNPISDILDQLPTDKFQEGIELLIDLDVIQNGVAIKDRLNDVLSMLR